ncbi:two-component system, OmpR family, response regulator RegX3 [Streptomyces sp. di50b]|nr:two-component system, OmpR family, response regulator RegX3 [Streptomyces sp. di50b]
MTRVLVVEDEESFSDALSYMLRKEGFEVAVATTGPDGLDEFDRNGADLVLLDLMLPGLPGTEVCRQLRNRSNVPVIMVTAKDSEIDKVVGLEIGADDYVTKPFSSRELVARIRAVLRRRGEPEEAAPAALEAGPVRMDVDRHVVTVDGTKIDLPLKEFDLLEMLLRNAGRVLTRMQLIDRVWGADYGGGHQDPRRPREASARQDRAGPGRAPLPGDRARPGLQVRAVDRGPWPVACSP